MRASLTHLVRALLCLALCWCAQAQAASYTATASAATAAQYPWIDISTTGTAVALGDDAVSAAIPLGFSFTFGSNSYTAVKVISNGMLQFGATSIAYANSPLPMSGVSGEPNIDAAMLPLWDDLYPGAGQVRYRSQGTAPNRVFIVSWNAVPYYGATAGQKATFQVQLYEQGQFVYRYGAVDGSGGTHTYSYALSNPAGATIGMEVSDGDALQYSRNSATVASGTTIVWTRNSTTSLVSGQLYSFESNYAPSYYIRHASPLGWVSLLSPSSSTSDRQDASFIARPGLASASCWSFESVNNPGYYLRHYNYRLRIDAYATGVYLQDATFCARAGLSNSAGLTLESYNYPGNYVRHLTDNTLSIGTNDGTSTYNARATFNATTALSSYAALVADYRFEETGWNGTAGELKDIAGYSGGPYNGKAQGSGLPTVATASPARSGNPGTCGYASLPGPISNGGSFLVSGLPVSTTAGAQTSVAFWMYWTGTDGNIAIGWNKYDVGAGGGAFGFNTDNSDVYGISATGLANGWHHVVAVFTNGSVTSNKLYIDGVAQTLSQRYGTPILGNAVVQSTMTIGGYGSSTYYRFAGRLDEVRVYNGAVTASDVATLYAQTHTCAATLDHLEIRSTSANGLTCAPGTFTVVACKDAACSATYTGGVSGTLTATGSGVSVSWPSGAAFSIPAGSGSTTVNMQLTSAGSVLMGASGLSLSPASSTTCNFGSPSCTYSAAAAALSFDVADHVSETSTTFSVSAVGSSGGSCSTAFASSTRNITFKCSYVNPSSGSRPVRVAGSALNSGNNSAAVCDATGRSVALTFNASGVATTTLQYADVGQVQLSATYTGSVLTLDPGLTMTGSDRFIAAPADFSFSAITAAPIRAGSAFSATVSARNAAGATTPNFGRETTAESALIDFARRQPTGTGASDGSFGGSLGAFSSGSATASDLNWSEVGTGDLTATLASGSYLGSGFTATGTTGTGGAVGRFIPHHFDTVLTPACSSFTYAGQPVSATVTARNAANGITVNYDGSAATSPSYAKVVTLSDVTTPSVGTLSANSIAIAAFTAGVASAAPVYTFTSKTTAPRALVLRAIDTDAVSSSGYTEGSGTLRSGRLRLSNAFGSASAALQVPVVAEYWSGSAWMLNSADSCTTIAAASVALSNPRSAAGGSTTAVTSASAISLANGSGLLTLAAPSPAGASLTLDLAVNLGSSGVDQSCQANHPATTGAAKAWLRAQNGACAATADRDPAARASFGIFSPETRKTVHVREIF